MWYWIIKVSILSLVFIFLLHYLYSFFVSTLTVPKVKDLVTIPQEKYDEMFHSLQKQPSFQQRINDTNDNNATATTQQSMKEDLIHFLKDLGSSSSSGSGSQGMLYNSNASAFDSLDSNISSFSFTK
jgi:hypothetical protein